MKQMMRNIAAWLTGKRDCRRSEKAGAEKLMQAIRAHPDWILIRVGEAIKARDEWRESISHAQGTSDGYRLNLFKQKASDLVSDRDSRAVLIAIHEIAVAMFEATPEPTEKWHSPEELEAMASAEHEEKHGVATGN